MGNYRSILFQLLQKAGALGKEYLDKCDRLVCQNQMFQFNFFFVLFCNLYSREGSSIILLLIQFEVFYEELNVLLAKEKDI